MSNTILLVCRNRASGLAALRSLGERGYKVDVIVSVARKGSSALISSSKYAREVVEVVSRRKKDYVDERLMNALLDYAEGHLADKALLLPCDYYSYRVLENFREDLLSFFKLSYTEDGQALNRAFRRERLAELAHKSQISARSEIWADFDKCEELIPDILFPCSCGPVEKVDDFGNEFKKCWEEDELRFHLQQLAQRDPHRQVRVIEAVDSNSTVLVYGFAFGSQVQIAGVARQMFYEDEASEELVASPMRICESSIGSALEEDAKRIVSALGFYGVFCAEFAQVGDLMIFRGISPFMSSSDRAYAMHGISPVVAFADYVFAGSCADFSVSDSFAEKLVNEVSVWTEYLKGRISRKDLFALLDEASVLLVSDEGDGAVDKVFNREMNKKAVRAKVKRGVRLAKPVVRQAYHVAVRYPQTKKKNQRDPESEKPRILVAGRAYSSNLCMARSLGEAGYDIEVLRVFIKRPRKRNRMRAIKPDAYSKYVKAFHICVTGRKRRRLLKTLIKIADPDRKMLLVPVDDFVASTVDHYYDRLSEFYILPSINEEQGEICRMMSKSVQKSMAAEAGLPVVGSCVVKSEEGQFTIPDTVKYPCFIKPNTSENSYKTRMRRCDSEEELFEVFAEYAEKNDFEMLVEDFVEIDREYSLLGLSVKEGVLCPGFFVAEVGGQKEHRGVALLGRVLPAEQQAKLIGDISKFIESLGYEGLFDVDLIGSTDGQMYFVELNLRFGGSGYAITQSGLNLPGMYADYKLYGKPIDFSAKVENPGKVFVNERILLDEYVRGRISAKEAKALMSRAEIFFMKNSDDLPAYRHILRKLPSAQVTRVVRARRERKEQQALESLSELGGASG